MVQFLYTRFLCVLFLTTAFQKLAVSVDTLFPNQTIAIGQTLISQNQLFELGFFTPGKSPNQFLGIWYKNTPDVVVWVANRNNPITDSQGVLVAVSRNGTLAISRGESIIWSSNSSYVASHPVLQLLDSGNLVLANGTMEGSSRSYIWQSFDSPTNTRLPGMKLVDDSDAGMEAFLTSWRSLDDPSPGEFVLKIENHGLPELVILRGKKKITRTGKWNGKYFSGVLPFPNHLCQPNLVFSGGRLISMEDPFGSPVIGRETVDPSGLYHHYTMNSRRDRWNLAYTSPVDTCDEYGLCGPNGFCSIDKPNRCECLKGFAPKFKKDWDLQDWSDGCTRITPLSCGSADGFRAIGQVKYPDMLKFWLNDSMDLAECQTECSRNCTCTAYANPYITSSGCVMWFDDLIDMREVPTADTNQIIYIRMPVSELVDDSSIDLTKEKKSQTRLLVISIASGVLVSGFINGSIFMLTKRKRRAAERIYKDLDLPSFKFATIVAATNNFSSENMIGEGGFGPVYKGNLPSKELIAIKRLSRTSGQGLEEFRNEVTLIAKLQHTNLVRLLGCCMEGDERMLIYEYLHNKSLDYFIFDQNRRTLLTWPKRFDIIMGFARGLLYLHHDSRLKIVHRDLKMSNILLDEKLNPKISDFGIARTFEEDQPFARTRRIIGTFGYMAPEYAKDGKFSVKSDIFSLGVVLLELVSGKKNRGFKCSSDHCLSLLEHAWWLWKENKFLELLDGCLNDAYVESEVKRCIHVALLCVQKYAEDRPEMTSVLFMLGTDGAIMPDPKEPGFFIGRSSTPEGSFISPSSISERNTITITDLEAR